MARNIAAGNWKMNLDLNEARELCSSIGNSRIPTGVEVILAAPSPYLYVLGSLAAQNNSLAIAAQNAHEQDKGAYTGEISHQILTSIGINHVVLGHSERRQFYKESNKLLKAKVDKLIENGFKIIFCCGEPLDIRKKKGQVAYVTKQLNASLLHLSAKAMVDQVIIAYEPIWAIGTGVTASPKQAQQMHRSIRHLLADKYSKTASNKVPILYGGSVKPANAKEIFSQKDVDGGLVGGASLKADSFKAIINSFG